VVLSHGTLERLGLSSDTANLSKLPDVSGALASGEKHKFKKLGGISLYLDPAQAIHICNTEAICHSTHETNDLLGTEAFKQFSGVAFNIAGDKYMELISASGR
jgi:hypothetical protein